MFKIDLFDQVQCFELYISGNIVHYKPGYIKERKVWRSGNLT